MAAAANRIGEGGAGAVLRGAGVEELLSMVEQLGGDPAVPEKLDRMPLPSAAAGASIVYRDADDVTTINRMTWVNLIVATLLAVSLIFNVVLYARRPSLVVVDKTTGQTLVVDDREYGKTPAAQMMSDNLLPEQKIYLVKEYLSGIYGINQSARGAQIQRAIRMMHPDTATQYATWLARNKVLEAQEAEAWQATWVVEDKNVTVDPKDDRIVTVVGEQTLSRMKGGRMVQQKLIINVKVLVLVSPSEPKRSDHNLQTGFCIYKFKPKVINASEESQFVLMNDGQE
ncbi:MAG TPA: hypothetical protein VFS10_16730 [Pyrinomonadaceae bacterium]|nr:hypothetical protein [Pyrinomonadaceae bacterium]